MPHVKAVTPETGATVDSAGVPMGWYGTIAVGRRSEDLPMLCSTDSKVTVPPSTPSSKLFNLSLSSEPGSLLIILWLGVNMPLEPLRELDLPIGFRNSRQKGDRSQNSATSATKYPHGVELSASSFGHAFRALDMLPTVVLGLEKSFLTGDLARRPCRGWY